MEWTRDKTMSLINEYRKRRGLWDMTHDDYRKKEIKQKLLVEVSSCLGGNIPILEIEKKFHTLRTQYHREINRMKRKEPYNSKWFGFKNLQFLSSPKACRSNKARIKSEITEEGTVTTKFIIRDTTQQQQQHDNSGGSVNSSNNINDEFLTIHRKPTISYEAVGISGTASTNRSHELEKLIEETTKDVEEIEEAKPKMTMKEITLPLDHHGYNSQLHANGVVGEVSAVEQDHLHKQQHHLDQDYDRLETIDIRSAEDAEMAYQSSSSTGNGPAENNTIHQQISMPTRIIKIQRRETCQEEDYYDDEQTQSQHHHIHTVPTSPTKRIYYEANGQQSGILNVPTSVSSQSNPNSIFINPIAGTSKIHLHSRGSLSQHHSPSSHQSSQHQMRDEFATYGEYVANEMRTIMNREILIALKHKINTALFEANMAQLQK